jgi:hypothetical protein
MAISAPSSVTGAALATREPKLADDQIIQIIQQQIAQAVGYSESKLSKERERVLMYYDGELPRRAHAGDSGYQSLDVYSAVEEMKAQLLDAFSANLQPVKFIASQGEPDIAAQVRTDYVTDVIFNQNGGYGLFRDLIDAALIGRNGICKVWWEVKAKTEYVSLSDIAEHELDAYLQAHQDEDPKVTEQDVHEDSTVFKRVVVRLRRNVSQVRIKLLAGEQFGISPMAESLHEADFVFHRHEMTISDLIKQGYDRRVVEDLQTNDRLWLSMEPERIARFEQTDDLIGTRVTETGQQARRVVMVYENYVPLDMDDTGEAQLYKVTTCGTTILDKEPVDRRPFVVFCPLPRPSAFWGHNYGKLLIHTQNARTYLTRGIINHTLTTNNPRTMVVKGALMNPRELMENRFGGLVNVTRPDGIVPLPQAPLNPFVMTTLQMLQANREEITSISALSQGLNKDAISKQNSTDLVQELINVSQLRQKIIARNFGEGFLRDLYTEVYRLVLENEDRQKIQRIAGTWIPVDFSQWPEETGVEVAFCLGYGEGEKEAQKWAKIDQALSNNQHLAGQYTPAQSYYVARKGLEAAGVRNIDSVLLPPDKAQPPPPNPMMQAEVAMKQADAKAKEAAAQATVMQQQLAMAELQSKERIEMARLNLERMKLQLELQLKNDTLAHKVAVDAIGLQLEAQAQEQDKLNANASVTVPG